MVVSLSFERNKILLYPIVVSTAFHHTLCIWLRFSAKQALFIYIIFPISQQILFTSKKSFIKSIKIIAGAL